VGQMSHDKNDFLDPKQKQAVKDLKDREIRGRSTGQKNMTAVSWGMKTENEEDELLARFELPIVVGAWVIILITFGYLIYVGV
jgi:hypothetical protein